MVQGKHQSSNNHQNLNDQNSKRVIERVFWLFGYWGSEFIWNLGFDDWNLID